MWLMYFLYWAGAAAVLPYISVYYESVNLKGTQIGQLNSIPFFVSMFSSVIFAFLSDLSKRHKVVLRLCAVGLIVVMLLFPTANNFSAFIPIVFAWSILNAPITPISDQASLNALDEPEKYGKLRVGGSIGWGIMVLVTGFLIDYLSFGLQIVFYIHVLFLVLFLINTIFIPSQHKIHDPSEKPATLHALWKMLRQPEFLVLLGLIIIWGIGESAIGNFLFLHIKSLGGSSTLMGISLSISLVGEILTFSYAHKIQAKIGTKIMMLMSFLVLFTWLMGLSLIRNPYAIPLFQVFGGSAFGLIQSGSVAYVNSHAPRELGTTAQAVRGGVMGGLGVGIGSLISGRIYEVSGSVVLFRTMSLVVLAGFMIGFTLYFFDRNNRQRRISS